MIRLEDSQIALILPEHLSDRASVQALSYALYRSVKRLVGYCGNIGVFSAIDTAVDNVLDRLALELGTQYYEDSLPIEVKRDMIRNTLSWYMNAGTPAAVEELVNTVFGKGEIHEWFQYGGEPYTFRIVTSSDAKYESIEEFEKLIEKVKNARSHLDEVIFARENEMRMYFASVNIGKVRVAVGWAKENKISMYFTSVNVTKVSADIGWKE